MEGICGKELIVVMSCIYNNYLNRNNTWITDNTVFSCIEKPTISIFDYLGRICTLCSDSSLILGMIYIDRLQLKSKIHINSSNIHKLLVTSIMVASKFNDDDYYSNSCYAKAGLVSLEELNLLECEFISAIEYNLYVTKNVFQEYCNQITYHYQHHGLMCYSNCGLSCYLQKYSYFLYPTTCLSSYQNSMQYRYSEIDQRIAGHSNI